MLENKNSKLCPACGKIQTYKTRGAFLRSLRNDTKCRKCNGKEKGYDTEIFIKKSKEKHGEKFDYSKSIYKGNQEKVAIICPIHGEFEQMAMSHMKGYDCRKCAKNFVDTELFIENSKNIFGDKYDYSKVKYTKAGDSVILICDKHGEFSIKPITHIHQKAGCRICSGYEITTEIMIDRCVRMHKDKYDYSKFIYNSVGEKVTVICKKHGDFKQNAFNHASGHGCPKCKVSNGEKIIIDYLNINKIDYKYEHFFENCLSVNGNVLKFDFYLPNLKCAIEYDGQQHFSPVNFRSEDNIEFLDRFYIQKKSDILKDIYCSKNNILLLRINYLEINNIEFILDEVINCLKY